MITNLSSGLNHSIISGLDGSRLGHRGSVRYQTDDGALNSQSDGKSTITYHGNYGGGDQFAGKTGSISAGQDGVVLVQDGGKLEIYRL